MATSKNTFLCTVTLTCILLDGGREPGRTYDNHQLWHANVVGSADQGVDIDHVQADEFSTSIAFWERNADLFPTEDCVAIVTGEAAFASNGSGDGPATELALKIRASQVCVLPNTIGDDSLNRPRYTQPIFNLMGYVGAGQQHATGCRSFDLTCSVYSVETKQPWEFMVRCFFDIGPRWKSYSIPRQGAFVHAVGTLVGKFSMSQDSIRPAILLNGYKALSGVTAIDTAIGPALTTPSPMRSTSKLAPPGYTKRTVVAPWSPETPSRRQATQALETLAGVAKAELVTDMNKEAASDSEGESVQTLLVAEQLEDGGDVAAEKSQLASRKRRRVR